MLGYRALLDDLDTFPTYQIMDALISAERKHLVKLVFKCSNSRKYVKNNISSRMSSSFQNISKLTSALSYSKVM